MHITKNNIYGHPYLSDTSTYVYHPQHLPAPQRKSETMSTVKYEEGYRDGLELQKGNKDTARDG